MTITVNSLVTELTRIFDDSSYSDTILIAKMTLGYRMVAGRVLLKDLESLGDITTDSTNNVALPSDYHRSLSRWGYSPSQEKRLKVYPNLSEMFMQFGVIDEAGAVIGLARNKKRLYYQPIPASAETINIIYHAYPTDLVAGQDVPDGIPEHLVKPLLINYAAAELFSEWEVGDLSSEAKTNTDYHWNEYEKAIAELKLFLYPFSDEPESVKE